MEVLPKMLICVSGNAAKIRTTFSPPLEFSHPYEIALTSLESYYSFPNINARNNHVRVYAGQWIDVYLETGCYEIRAINTEIQRIVMEKTGDTKAGKRVVLSANPNTLRCILTIADDCKVDFSSETSLCSVLGFEKKEYPSGRHQSENIVNILSVNSILVHCDVIESSRLNGIPAPVIYTFFPEAAPGDKIVSTPRHLIYIPVTLSVISRMTCWVTDQDNNELDLQGEELTLTFHLKACTLRSK